jgi:hypothetical protein
MPLRSRALAFTLAALLASAAEPQSIASLIYLVRDSIAHHESDNKLAARLRKILIIQKLDDHTIEELESEGAGPKSVAELLDLRDNSAGLPAPVSMPEFPAPPSPNPAEQDEVLRAAAVNAGKYSAELPDFICTEIIHRYEDIGAAGRWKLKDVLKVKLTYFDHREHYQLAAINNHPTASEYDYTSVGGAISEGEFGSDLLTLFLPRSKTQTQWDHWTHLRNRDAHVFVYRIETVNSNYRLVISTWTVRRARCCASTALRTFPPTSPCAKRPRCSTTISSRSAAIASCCRCAPKSAWRPTTSSHET